MANIIREINNRWRSDKLVDGYPITVNNSSELDSAVVTIKNENELDIQIYDKVKIASYLTNDVRNVFWLVSSINRVISSYFDEKGQKSKKYTYTLTLCELTKLLEGVVLPQRAYTNTYASVASGALSCLDYFKRITSLYIKSLDTLFVKDDTIKVHYSLPDEMTSKMMPEKTYAVQTLREFMDDILSMFNARVRLSIDEYNNRYIITYEDILKLNNEIDVIKNNLTITSMTNDASNFASALDCSATNDINDISLKETLLIQSNDVLLTTDNIVLKTTNKIDSINRFKIVVQNVPFGIIYRDSDGNAQAQNFVCSLSLKLNDYLVEKSIFDTYPILTKGDSFDNKIRTRYNTLYFKQGDNAIENFATAIDGVIVSSTGYSITYILKDVFSKIGAYAKSGNDYTMLMLSKFFDSIWYPNNDFKYDNYNITHFKFGRITLTSHDYSSLAYTHETSPFVSVISQEPKTFYYTVDYQPLTSYRNIISKETSHNFVSLNNTTSEGGNYDNYISKSQSNLIALGNDTLTFKGQTTDSSLLPQLNDYYIENDKKYVVSSCTYSIYNSIITFEGTLDANFLNIQMSQEIDRQKRYTTISSDNVVERNEVIQLKQKIKRIVAGDHVTKHDAFNFAYFQVITEDTINTKYNVASSIKEENSAICLPVTYNNAGRLHSYAINMLDNVSAGSYIDKYELSGTTRYITKDVMYVDCNGELKDINLELQAYQEKASITDNLDAYPIEKQTIINVQPLMHSVLYNSTVSSTYNYSPISCSFNNVFKDSREKLNLTIQIREYTDDNDIILGIASLEDAEYYIVSESKITSSDLKYNVNKKQKISKGSYDSFTVDVSGNIAVVDANGLMAVAINDYIAGTGIGTTIDVLSDEHKYQEY